MDSNTATTCIPFSFAHANLDREASAGVLEYDSIQENPPVQPPRSAAPGASRRRYYNLHGQKWVHEGNAESLESPYGNDAGIEQLWQRKKQLEHAARMGLGKVENITTNMRSSVNIPEDLLGPKRTRIKQLVQSHDDMNG